MKEIYVLGEMSQHGTILYKHVFYTDIVKAQEEAEKYNKEQGIHVYGLHLAAGQQDEYKIPFPYTEKCEGDSRHKPTKLTPACPYLECQTCIEDWDTCLEEAALNLHCDLPEDERPQVINNVLYAINRATEGRGE